MTLRDYYDNLPKTKQTGFRSLWMQKNQKSKSNFYLMLKNASESDIRLFHAATGVECTEIHKPVVVQYDIFKTPKYKQQ